MNKVCIVYIKKTIKCLQVCLIIHNAHIGNFLFISIKNRNDFFDHTLQQNKKVQQYQKQYNFDPYQEFWPKDIFVAKKQVPILHTATRNIYQNYLKITYQYTLFQFLGLCSMKSFSKSLHFPYFLYHAKIHKVAFSIFVTFYFPPFLSIINHEIEKSECWNHLKQHLNQRCFKQIHKKYEN